MTYPLTFKAIEQLTALEAAATPAPWAYTEGCGATVAVGEVHNDDEGEVRLKKNGFFLFEIEPDTYDRGDDAIDEDQCLEKAFADTKLIALMRNYLPALLDLARQHLRMTRPIIIGSLWSFTSLASDSFRVTAISDGSNKQTPLDGYVQFDGIAGWHDPDYVRAHGTHLSDPDPPPPPSPPKKKKGSK